MGLFYILILVPLVSAARRFDGPSYRSNVMEGDKPILRMSPNADYEESGSDEYRQPNPPPSLKDPKLVRELTILVNWLMDNFRYDLVPLGRKNNNDNGDDNVVMNTEASEPITEDPLQSPMAIKKTDLRTHKTKKKKEESKPAWVKDLKEFIKDQATHYGQQEVLEHAKPVIASLEKKHYVKIRDIDVDEYGEIHITYVEKGKGKKTARKGKIMDET